MKKLTQNEYQCQYFAHLHYREEYRYYCLQNEQCIYTVHLQQVDHIHLYLYIERRQFNKLSK